MSAIPLAILLGLSGAILTAARIGRSIKRQKEGFASQDGVIADGTQKYNPVANLLDFANNPFVGPSPNPSAIQSARSDIQGALAGVKTRYQKVGSGAPVKLSGMEKNTYNIPSSTSGQRSYDVQMCEKVTTADCSAFSDPNFAAKCGICFQPGSDSQAQGHIGGLYLDPEDVTAAQLQAEASGGQPSYYPSVGTCPPGMFAKDQASCQAIAKRIQCQQKKTYNIPNCAQCYSDGSFNIVDASVPLSDLSLVVGYVGTLTVTGAGSSSPLATASSATPSGDTTLDLGTVTEGTAIILTVDGAPLGVTPLIGGFVQGPTATGVFQLQIAQLADADLVSGTQPRFSGEVTVNGQSCVQIAAATGQTKLSIRLTIPVTFVDVNDPTAASCPSGPYLTLEGSAASLNAGNCFGAGNGPGAYSMACLQQKFTELGCTTAGGGYPKDAASLAALNTDSTGIPRQLGDIADLIYENSIRAATGVNGAGQSLSVADWNTASMFCTGKQITTPCDGDTVTQECLGYLWGNGGAGGQTGATYTSTTQNASLKGVKNRYCTTSGLLSPFDPDGKPVVAAINRAFAAGGTITDIKALYDSTHRMANDNTQSDSARAGAISDCYGVSASAASAQHSWALDSTVGAGASTGSNASTYAALKTQYQGIMNNVNYLTGLGLNAGSGNASYNYWTAQLAAFMPQIQTTIKARYVRLRPPKGGSTGSPPPCLQISQLQVFNSSGQELAKGNPTSAANVSTQSTGSAVAVDGNAIARAPPNIYLDTCTGGGSWWMVDLGSEQPLSYIVYFNRSDSNANLANGIRVELLDADNMIVGATTITGTAAQIQVNFTIFDTHSLPWANLT